MRKGDKSTYLGRNDQGTEEDPLVCPLLESDMEMGASTVEVGESGEEYRKLNLSAGENVVYECGEGRIVSTALELDRMGC